MCHSDDPNLTYIPALIKNLTQQATDLDWEGYGEKADRLWKRIDELRSINQEEGPWLPNF